LDNELDPIEYCIYVILKEAKEEYRLVRQVLYVMLSAYTNNPLNLAINSPSGEGKNWVLEKVAEKFPSNDVIFISGMTDKALFHKRGTLVVDRHDIDKNNPKEYVQLDKLIKEIDGQIQDKENEIERTKDRDLIEGLKAVIEDLNLEKKELFQHTKKLIDLSHKILVFMDTPKMNLLTTIMSLLSHDRYEAEYEYVNTHNGITTCTNILRGWPAVIFAQAIDYSKHERWPELQRRFIITNPEMKSKEKYSKAVDLMLNKFGLPDLVYQKIVSSDHEKDRVRDIIKSIGEEILAVSDRIAPGKNSTFIPYTEALKHAIPKDKSSDMNAGKRFSEFLSLLPILNLSRRPTIKIPMFKEDGPVMQTVPFALFEDLKESIYLMEYANGVRPYILEWFYSVFLPTFECHKEVSCKSKIVGAVEQMVSESKIAVTTSELIDATREITGRVYSSKQLLETYVYSLLNQGYIDRINSELDHRAFIYYPVITSKYINLFDNRETNSLSQICRINVGNIASYPDKTYLISRIEEILKYYSEEKIRTSLWDNNGKEISAEELVVRYYSKPEDYFEAPGCHDNNDNDYDNSPTDSKEQEPVIKKGFQDEYSEISQKQGISQESLLKNEGTINREDEQSTKLFDLAKTNNIIYS
jgi:hypothetical protein